MNTEEIVQDRVKDSELLKRTITVETVRFPLREYFTGFKERFCFSGIHSKISLSEPMKDFKGEYNKQFFLKVANFNGSFGIDNYWSINLDNEKGYSLISKDFGSLPGSLSDYSEEKLKKWGENTIRKYGIILNKIEDLYFRGEGVPANLYRTI